MNTIHKQQIPVPATASEVHGPVPGTVMGPEYASVIGRMAYGWGWPLVNMHNRREMFRQMPRIAYVGGAPMAPPNRLGMYTDAVDVNELNRYSLGTKNKTLQYADDGSLTIHVQHDKPADHLVSNWLPSPADDFAMTIRCYWPDEVLQKGDWLPPIVGMVN